MSKLDDVLKYIQEQSKEFYNNPSQMTYPGYKFSAILDLIFQKLQEALDQPSKTKRIKWRRLDPDEIIQAGDWYCYNGRMEFENGLGSEWLGHPVKDLVTNEAECVKRRIPRNPKLSLDELIKQLPQNWQLLICDGSIHVYDEYGCKLTTCSTIAELKIYLANLKDKEWKE